MQVDSVCLERPRFFRARRSSQKTRIAGGTKQSGFRYLSDDSIIKPSRDDRFAVYLGAGASAPIVLDERSIETIVVPSMDFDSFWRTMQCGEEGKKILQKWDVLKLHNQFSGHVLPVVQLCKSLDIDQPCLVKIFDNRTDFARPVFCKSVDITQQKLGRYILPLDYKRHWPEAFNLPD